MKTMTETREMAASHAASQPCSCKCADSQQICCRLDCLVQPRFYCGQLLTDRDLTATVAWAKHKFALSRYRHGWGVVCGLDVRHDPAHPGTVEVGPGYAISCCGDDIIVCEPTTKDLSTECQDLKDECYDPSGPGCGCELSTARSTTASEGCRFALLAGWRVRQGHSHRPVHPVPRGAEPAPGGPDPRQVRSGQGMRVQPDPRDFHACPAAG